MKRCDKLPLQSRRSRQHTPSYGRTVTENLPEPKRGESIGGPVTIAVLVIAILALLATSGLLWVQAQDARMQANAEARVRIMKAEDEAARAKQQAVLLRDKVQKLKQAAGIGVAKGSPPENRPRWPGQEL